MRIAFFGSSLVSAYWNGAATYYRGILRALAARGHAVTFYEPDAYDRQKHRDIPDPPWARVVVYPADGETGVRRALAAGADADLVVKASGVGVFDALLEAAVLELRRPDGTRPLCAFWDVDAPATLERVRGAEGADARSVRGADPALRRGLHLRRAGRRWSPRTGAGRPALRADLQRPRSGRSPAGRARRPRFTGDLGFLANRLPDREARVEEFFLRAAAALPERVFVLGGSGWHDKAMPANVRAVGHVYTRDHNAFNASTPAVLNVNRDSMARFGYSPATRVFEAAGAGACVVTDAFVGVETFFAPDREILVARDGAEVARILARAHARARAGDRRGRAAARAGPSTPTISGRCGSRRCWTTCSAERRGAARLAAGAVGVSGRASSASDGSLDIVDPGAVDHLVVGERPRHDLSRAGQGAGRARPPHSLLRARRPLVRREPRSAAARPSPRSTLYGSLDELRDRHAAAGARRRSGDRRLVRPRGDRRRRLGTGRGARPGGVLRHRHAGHAGGAGAGRRRVPVAGADPGLRPLPVVHRRSDAAANRARAGLADGAAALLRRRSGRCTGRMPPLPAWELGYMGTYSADRQPALERLLLDAGAAHARSPVRGGRADVPRRHRLARQRPAPRRTCHRPSTAPSTAGSGSR